MAIGAAPDERTAHAVQMIADVNPDHRLPGDTATERAVNTLAERHASAEARLSLAAGGRTRRAASERDSRLAVLSGLDVPVGVVDDRGRSCW